MSHLMVVQVEITDTNAFVTALQRMGFEVAYIAVDHENGLTAKTYSGATLQNCAVVVNKSAFNGYGDLALHAKESGSYELCVDDMDVTRGLRHVANGANAMVGDSTFIESLTMWYAAHSAAHSMMQMGLNPSIEVDNVSTRVHVRAAYA